MANLLQLTLQIGKGVNAEVYDHPNQPGWVVKISTNANKPMDTELKLMKQLQRLLPAEHQGRIIEFENDLSVTNKGPGLVMRKGNEVILFPVNPRHMDHDTEKHSNTDPKSYYKWLLDTVEAMHGVGFVHCDLRPDNVVTRQGVFKLIDFGSGGFDHDNDDFHDILRVIDDLGQRGCSEGNFNGGKYEDGLPIAKKRLEKLLSK